MFLRKKAKKPFTGIRETVAGITSQIDHLVAIIQDNNSPSSDRITATEIVRSFVDFQSLSSITEIWYATSGLTSIENAPEVRRAGWRLCASCIARDELNNSAFSSYYASIIRNANVEDFELVMNCLEQLTNGGRRVVGTQAPRHLPQVLLEWIQLLAIRSQEIRNNPSRSDIALQWGASTEDSFHRLMTYTIALLKFNMAMWEPVEIEELLIVVVAIVRQTSQPKDGELCCSVMEAVLAYGLIPASVLQPILEVLCGMITMVPALKNTCERIIYALSSGHLQNSTFVRLCRILDSPNSEITTSMRIAAAKQLKNLLMRSRSDSDFKNEEERVSDATNGDKGGGEDRVPVATHQRLTISGDEHSPAHRLPDFESIDPSLPVSEVLEAYYQATKDAMSQPKLVIALVQCCNELIADFGLLKWVRSAGIRDDDDKVPDDPEPFEISLGSLITLFDHTYMTLEPKDLAECLVLFKEMRQLATYLVDSLTEKDLASSFNQQILLSIRISNFLETEACETLLSVLDSMHMCTPGIPGWSSHLQEVLQFVYNRRTDKCRATILRMIQPIYAFDLQEEGWVTKEELAQLTNTAFDILGSADEETLSVLLNLYEETIFATHIEIFQEATNRLVAAAINRGLVEAVRSIIRVLSRAFKLYVDQSLTALEALQQIALNTVEKPAVFVHCWAVLCRLRSDRWNRLNIIEQGVAEENYGPDLLSQQEGLPVELQSPDTTRSLVVKIRTEPASGADDDPESKKFDTSQLLRIAIDALKCSTERTFVLVVINLASQIAHYKFLCNPALSQNSRLLGDLRDCILQIINSGGSRMPHGMTAARRNASLNVLVHILTILQPLKELSGKTEQDKMLQVIVHSLGQRNIHTSWAVYYLLVACYESPSSIQRFLPQIISRLQLKITSRDSNIYILDFLLSISLRGSLTKNFTIQDYKQVFGMSFLFIQNANDMLSLKEKQNIGAQWRLQLAYSAINNLFLSIKLENRRSLVPYLTRTIALTNKSKTRLDPSSLVTYDLINRFTYSDVPLRVNMISFPENQTNWEVRRWLRGVAITEIRCNRRTGDAYRIVRRPAGVLVTKMQPVLIEDVESRAMDHENDEIGEFSSNFYLMCGQLGLATFNCRVGNEKSDSVTNQSTEEAGIPKLGGSAGESGSIMTRSSRNLAEPLSSVASPVHSTSGAASYTTEENSNSNGSSNNTNSFGAASNDFNNNTNANAVGLNKVAADIISGYTRPLQIPEDAANIRAIKSLDRVPIVDFYKVGIIYVAPGQREEKEILANSCGSFAYRQFLNQIGTLIRLKNNRTYYVGGLDTDQDLDGEFAIAWSSKIAQIIFHTTTMMPQIANDVQFANKKRHIGNNFVNVYFDESGEDFVFDIVKSQFNFINIVITPTYLDYDGRRYWKVRALKKEGMVNSLAAYEVKVVDEANLSLFVRNLALKASQYAAIHNLNGDYMDNWVYRSQLITNLHDRLLQQQSQNLESHAKQRKDASTNQVDPNNTDEHDANISDDDYSLEDADLQKNADIDILNWMDFTKFTI